jgi:hypothetical protein
MSGRDWISPDYPWTVRMTKGTSGGANGKIEYICEAEPGSDTAAAVWRARKMIYDSTGFQTEVLWCDSDRKFDNIATDPSLLTYG